MLVGQEHLTTGRERLGLDRTGSLAHLGAAMDAHVAERIAELWFELGADRRWDRLGRALDATPHGNRRCG